MQCRLLWAQYKSFKHYCYHITRNVSWKLAVWFTWHRPCVIELCQQLMYAGICNWRLFWTFVEHFCNFSLWPPHNRIMTMCVFTLYHHSQLRQREDLPCVWFQIYGTPCRVPLFKHWFPQLTDILYSEPCLN
jgi:hypothetical protein